MKLDFTSLLNIEWDICRFVNNNKYNVCFFPGRVGGGGHLGDM